MDISDSIEIDDLEISRPRSRRGRARRRDGSRDAAEGGKPARPSARRNGRDAELKGLLRGIRSLRDGDFTARVADSDDPLIGEIVDAFNELAARNERVVEDIEQVSSRVGRQGQMEERVPVGTHTGGWATIVGRINSLITDLVAPTKEVARVLTAVAEGDLSEKMALQMEGRPVQGEFLRIGTTVNTMVDQLSAFASEVTRVAREVGTEGRLGGQAEVVRVEYRPTSDGGVQVSVVDQGGGIAAGDQARIFDEFVQVAGEEHRHQHGTGLGLAISRRLAELLEGTLEVESTPGVGSRFCLTLPPAIMAPGSAEDGQPGR